MREGRPDNPMPTPPLPSALLRHALRPSGPTLGASTLLSTRGFFPGTVNPELTSWARPPVHKGSQKAANERHQEE